jgi:prepilin-type N-terminal cleavage/methylation domain-containing protein
MKIMKIQREKGFTLIEVIVVLVMLGIMGAVLATAVVTAVDGYMFTRDSAIKSQKAQLALARIERELLDMTTINSAPSSTSVDYTTSDGRQLQLTKIDTGTDIEIRLEQTVPATITGPQTLIGDVSTYADSGSDVFLSFKKQDTSDWVYGTDNISALYQIKAIIKLEGYGGVTTLTFETTVNPRNNKLSNAPILYLY